MNERAATHTWACLNKTTVIRLWLPLALAAAVLFAANAQPIYLATVSEPPCVAHARQGEGSAEHDIFSAAQSSCTPPPAAQAISAQGETQ
jgi:hypothetical protein